ncbi:hypothetical protein ElyMa_001838800 [Elysia marginata]|uniref:Uncharacterized protein n=1 Tax=Elysia marginata TaxID=1093978 RepID=A0AAV4EKM5_9GAST|nr:hypothetical protein ElyMa_001838800 [Elysia marginata]
MDDIEEKCEDNLTDSDSTPILSNKSFILPSNAMTTASEQKPAPSTATSLANKTTTTTPYIQSMSHSSTTSAKSSPPSSTKTSSTTSSQVVTQRDDSNQPQEISDSAVTAATCSLAGERPASGKSHQGNLNSGTLIGSQTDHSKKMASSLQQPPSKPASCSSSSVSTAGPASQIGSYNNPKYRIASSLSSSILPTSSSSSSTSPYKRMPHLHKLEK